MITISVNEFAARRKQLLDKIGNDGVVIIPSAPEYWRNHDNPYPYRQASDFYYLTGFPEPDAVAVLTPKGTAGEYILFNRPRNPAQETWTGKRAGQAGAVAIFAADEAYSIEELASKLPELLANHSKVYMPLGQFPEFDKLIFDAVNIVRGKIRSGINAPVEFINIDDYLHEMRLFKSPAEIAVMKQAADISAQAHQRAMRICQPGMYEYQLEAALVSEFLNNGSRSPAYAPIVGSGENACILHYHENTAQMRDGDLVLIDAGCEYQLYASDITRTFPVNGKFNSEQRAVYETVLRAQLAVIDMVKPGTPFNALNDLANRKLTEGLIELGILKGQLEELLAKRAFEKFYMHKIGHWLGIDTHDVGSYRKNGEWRELQSGMVLTVEPGLYISPADDVDEKWWNIGIRIEDDVVVTETGHEVISAAVPKQIDEIETLMRA